MCFYGFIYCNRLFHCLWCFILLPLRCLRRVVTRQRIFHLFQLLIIYIATLTILFITCQNLPYSMFYRSYSKKGLNYDRIKTVNEQRRYRAYRVLSQLKPGETRELYLRSAEAEHLKYAIGVVTTVRETFVERVGKLEYLTQVMTQLHSVVAKSGAKNQVFPFMCVVDSKAEDHAEAIGLSQYFPNITKVYSPTYEQKGYLNGDERQKQDYVFCLEAALQYNADYVMLLEDDAYPNDNFLDVLDHLIETKLESHIRRGERTPNDEQWGWVKLMMSYSLTKFHRNWFFFYQWIALSLLSAGSTCLAYYLYNECFRSTKSMQNYSYASSFYTLILTFLFFLMVIWIIGRPYFMQLRSFSPYFYALEPGTSCCIPAVLFRPSEAQRLVDFLNSIKCSRRLPLDFAMERYRVEKQVKQYLVSPNIFSHIGFYSSLRRSFNQNDAEFL